MADHLKRGLKAKRESKYVDFKRELDLKEPGAWCEIIKDMIAMANSGGGVILVGLDNGGKPSGFDPVRLLGLDPAVVTDRIFKYTGLHFSDFEISDQRKGRQRLAAILVGGVPTPIVFTKPGTYAVSDKEQKRAFSAGTVYFRHGAKSEPGTTEDLRRAIEREKEIARKALMKGLRKVVSAPPGSQVLTFPAQVEVQESVSPDAQAIRIVDDPDAPGYRKIDYDQTHPYRQKEVIRKVNQALAGAAEINQYDMQCVKAVYEIEDNESFWHRGKFSGSPQYTPRFVDWLVGEFRQDPKFFKKTRREAQKQRPR